MNLDHQRTINAGPISPMVHTKTYGNSISEIFEMLLPEMCMAASLVMRP